MRNKTQILVVGWWVGGFYCISKIERGHFILCKEECVGSMRTVVVFHLCTNCWECSL